jgi:hypothetical protein
MTRSFVNVERRYVSFISRFVSSVEFRFAVHVDAGK